MTDTQLSTGFVVLEATSEHVVHADGPAQPLNQEATAGHSAQGAVNEVHQLQPATQETTQPVASDSLPADRKGQMKGTGLRFLSFDEW
jgi:hypothetical protein